MKIWFSKRKKNQNDQKQTEKKKKTFQWRETKPGPPDVEGQRPLSIAPGQLTLKTRVKLIIYTIFAHEILPVDAV